MFQSEQEILLPPGSEFEVVSNTCDETGLHIVTLQEKQPKYPNLEPVETQILPSGCRSDSTSPNSGARTPKKNKLSLIVDLSHKRLTDACIKRITDDAVVEKQCTELNLSCTGISPRGAAILADALANNT
ncbi:unnamed protein product, partial [Rotaria sp. Silwood2]